MLANDLGPAPPGDTVNPEGVGLLLSVAVLVNLFHRQREVRDRYAGSGELHLAVGSNISNEHHFIQHMCFDWNHKNGHLRAPILFRYLLSPWVIRSCARHT
jgi:hypothetical protein